mmetsp:Transcript_6766/g.23740  ORF Transcript_6766/g.23740 Transcript_6766/m.23740 type:complete len:378 (+) Transcript_6766:1200-2333(+)
MSPRTKPSSTAPGAVAVKAYRPATSGGPEAGGSRAQRVPVAGPCFSIRSALCCAASTETSASRHHDATTSARMNAADARSVACSSGPSRPCGNGFLFSETRTSLSKTRPAAAPQDAKTQIWPAKPAPRSANAAPLSERCVASTPGPSTKVTREARPFDARQTSCDGGGANASASGALELRAEKRGRSASSTAAGVGGSDLTQSASASRSASVAMRLGDPPLDRRREEPSRPSSSTLSRVPKSLPSTKKVKRCAARAAACAVDLAALSAARWSASGASCSTRRSLSSSSLASPKAIRQANSPSGPVSAWRTAPSPMTTRFFDLNDAVKETGYTWPCSRRTHVKRSFERGSSRPTKSRQTSPTRCTDISAASAGGAPRS